MAVSIRDLSKSFGEKKVLNGVSLEIPAGQSTVVIGPSGCGKSTILRMIVGLLNPDSGSIACDGKEVTRMSPRELGEFRQRIGIVFQSSALFDSMTVGENVSFALSRHTRLSQREKNGIVEEKLRVVGLEGSSQLYPAELSGGMQKRVAFARAIARDPLLILYDEPTTGLDPIMSTVIEDLINAIGRESGATSVVVTHQLSTIFRTSQRIAMLSRGQVIGVGKPEEMKNTKDPLIRDFLDGRPS
ncbi:MAG TPA: ABC transporter ATP-binding protein [Cyanobacteria bacterium UBA8530]|nr:ABC transporter ATP-binding protein [Cyanobacteria bacterium UBA8530]